MQPMYTLALFLKISLHWVTWRICYHEYKLHIDVLGINDTTYPFSVMQTHHQTIDLCTITELEKLTGLSGPELWKCMTEERSFRTMRGLCSLRLQRSKNCLTPSMTWLPPCTERLPSIRLPGEKSKLNLEDRILHLYIKLFEIDMAGRRWCPGSSSSQSSSWLKTRMLQIYI